MIVTPWLAGRSEAGLIEGVVALRLSLGHPAGHTRARVFGSEHQDTLAARVQGACWTGEASHSSHGACS
jgi:hypothetical protein